MKRLCAGLFGLVVATTAVAPASAADMPPPPGTSYYPSYFPGPYNWGGIYFGINGGYGFGQSGWSDPNNPLATTTGKFNSAGGLVGGTLGANFQVNQFVFGIEADLDWSDIHGNTGNGYCGLTNSAGAIATNCQTQNTWLGTVRGRLGYAWDGLLLYGTGGLAVGDVQAGLTNGGAIAGYDSSTEIGWTAGGGVEVAFSRNWTGKIEYLHVKLGNGTCTTTANCGIDALPFPTNDTVSFSANIIRLGVNYKFGP